MVVPVGNQHSQDLINCSNEVLGSLADLFAQQGDVGQAIIQQRRALALREQHSPRSIGFVGIGGQANHMDAPFGLTWLQGVGSKRWFNAFAQEKTQHFLVSHWMFDAAPSVFFHPDLDNTRYAIVMGTNPRISNRGHNPNDTFRSLVEREDCRLVVVDPRETETTRGADRHLRVRPGADAYLLLALAATIANSEGLVDASFLAEKTHDFEELRMALAQVESPEFAIV